MAKELSYSQQHAQEITLSTREILRELPDVCADFLRAIEPTTQPLTRFAYAYDLKLFFHYLQTEVPRFAGKTPTAWTCDDLDSVTARDLSMYLEYLSLYYKDEDTAVTNAELGKMRKLSSLRSFYHYLFKNSLIKSDVTTLVDMPKRHEKPIIRLEVDEVARLLDLVESGEKQTQHQKRYNDHTRLRDLAILTLFLGTGIRVSELVGIDIDDLDFELGGFMVTRKGGGQAVLYFPDEVADVLKDYLRVRRNMTPLPGHENALFLSLQNRRISVRAVQVMVKKYATQAAPLKKHLSPHKLRSTFGTNLYQETGDIYLVADVLGHADVNTTRRHYAAMADERRRMAARKVKLREDAPAGKPDGAKEPEET
ncbi:MAG TPA: tyrosine-type recombinase/integrase [Candidatus Pullichristensenella stercorigallinarum]|uniref:Tyrosine-type recombinase/integrase n=1 Tax=Candidatus Pullichristensenella stercorigallinarum TaxID=2840909 RepID=A0A9D0ZMI8_9FIRM|nr:tyrosine-type recombinase/integrase [Candidatus Pullichristensenella stercorigallinarum]